MTDNEIIKAWKWHISPVHCNGMEIYSAVVECSRELAKNTLDLINRQKAEIERLEKELMKCKLEKEMLYQTVEEIKSEAIKEFAERLKGKCYEDFQETYEMLSPYVTDDDIDNIVKEMTEVNENE